MPKARAAVTLFCMEQTFCPWSSYKSTRLEKARRWKNHEFRRYYGVKRRVFVQMVTELHLTRPLPKYSGRPPKLNLAEQLLCALECWRHAPTYEVHAMRWDVSKRTAWHLVSAIEIKLLSLKTFRLPGKKVLRDKAPRHLIIDATETPIQRPQKKRELFYSGKKKRHTMKTQLVVDANTHAIICLAHVPGATHDFELFKQSRLPFDSAHSVMGDSGYQGILGFHKNSKTPQKKVKKSLFRLKPKLPTGCSRVSASWSNTSSAMRKSFAFSQTVTEADRTVVLHADGTYSVACVTST